jgi:tRNA 2-thiouridine synthesizing protein C|tara:strand:- start:600 stop:950 length:351 start_codon:yes stop_codon:yes gene_type:complete
MSCLITLSHAPYGSQDAKEALDVALVLAAFEQQPALLFIDEGILQLLPNSQSPSSHKHIGKIISALEMYEINELWVEQESLDYFGIMVDELSQPVKVINRAQVSQLCAQYHQHLVF